MGGRRGGGREVEEGRRKGKKCFSKEEGEGGRDGRGR